MLPTKRLRIKTEEHLTILWMCVCIPLIGGSCLQQTASTASETAARNIKVQSSTAVTPQDSKDSEAQQALDQADALRANWTAASLREAIDHYDKAALLWISNSDFASASDATLKSGEVYFLLSEFKQALERYEKAEALAEKSDDWLAQAKALSHVARVQSYVGNNDLAHDEITKALHLFEQHADTADTADTEATATNAYAQAIGNLAEISYSRGDVVNAFTQLEKALKLLQSDPKAEARVRLLHSHIAGTIGDTNKAGAESYRALQLYREANDKSGEGLALTVIGLWHSSNRHEDHAIQMHDKAREIFRAIGNQHSEAIALNAIGQAYENLNDYSNALFYYKSGLGLFEKTGALDAASGITCGIAGAQYKNGDLDQALASYERCLKLSRATGNVRIEAYALKGVATVYGAQQRVELASRQYQNSIRFFERIGDFRGHILALNEHGDLFLRLGEHQKALDIFHQAFSLTGKIGDKGFLLSALYNLARANQALGRHDVALSLIKQSLEMMENIRANVGSPDFRASYFSGVRQHYDLCIDILMQLDRLRPGQNFAADAFFMSEKGRARLLLDLLSESRVNINKGATKDLVERERMLSGLIQNRTEHRINLTLRGNVTNEIAEVDAELAQLRSRFQVVQAQLREGNPRLFAFERFAPVDLQRVQKELSDEDTMLLEYALGDERSYLWAVTSNSVQTYELPDRKTIEDAANKLYESITARAAQSNEDYFASIEASKLSQMLLGAVAERLGNRRLVVVIEGALQYIPFDSLPVPVAQTPDPIGASKPLLETNEVVVLPSASTLIAIRGARKDKRSPSRLVAIIADPVFSSSDERVQSKALSNPDPDQLGHPAIESLKLARLGHSSEEADAIVAVAPRGSTLVAKGFDASREVAMSSDVRQSQIIHFATHGFVDSKHPESSAIILTMMDRHGIPANGLMPLPDIYSLDLSADLIVLSACQTALGKDMKGEGFVGLAHSFMSAGANSVVASLWKVDDRATAVLMADFYDSMLQKGMSPAAALRSAKLKMMRDKRWSAPYYWAGFVLQGEYMNRIEVDRYSWLRPVLILLSVLILIAAAVFVFRKRRRRLSPARSTFMERKQ
jgi:CHAT domain-containing protein